ncbi:MAG: hypothetical protein WBP12_05235 [Candidatus Saccharimonas sp.]
MMLEKNHAVEEVELPPVPEGVPDVLPDTLPRVYETERLLIKATEEKELRFEDWIPECPTLWYDVYAKKDGRQIADLGIYYDYESNMIFIDNVGIITGYGGDDFNRGYGVEMYAAVPTMSLPDGRTPDEAGFIFATEEHSAEAERVWQSLERRGLVINVGQQAYLWTGRHTK